MMPLIRSTLQHDKPDIDGGRRCGDFFDESLDTVADALGQAVSRAGVSILCPKASL